MAQSPRRHVREDLDQELVRELVDVDAVVVEVLDGLVTAVADMPVDVALEFILEESPVQVPAPQKRLEA